MMVKSWLQRQMPLLSGPAAFVLGYVICAPQLGAKGAAAMGMALWMALRWVFRPVDIAVTSMLPIVINSHTPVEPHILSLSHRISEIVANLTVIRMEKIYKIGYSCGTVVNRHFIVLVPLSCGISCIVDDINPCISQLGKVGGERYNLVQLVDFLRVVLH